MRGARTRESERTLSTRATTASAHVAARSPRSTGSHWSRTRSHCAQSCVPHPAPWCDSSCTRDVCPVHGRGILIFAHLPKTHMGSSNSSHDPSCPLDSSHDPTQYCGTGTTWNGGEQKCLAIPADISVNNANLYLNAGDAIRATNASIVCQSQRGQEQMVVSGNTINLQGPMDMWSTPVPDGGTGCGDNTVAGAGGECVVDFGDERVIQRVVDMNTGSRTMRDTFDLMDPSFPIPRRIDISTTCNVVS